MKLRVLSAVLLAIAASWVATACGSAGPTRASVEADEDRFCRAVARARELENEYGLNPNVPAPDGGEAGAK